MFRNTLILALVVFSQCLANPIPDPDPGYHKTHIRVHIPTEVHTLHHHHIQKVPVLHEVPVIKEVPVLKEVPVIKHVPLVHTVHVPVVKTVAIEKPVFLPYKESIEWSHWH